MADSTSSPDVVKHQHKKWYPTLTILSKEKPPVPKERTVCPEYNAGFLSLLTFQWTAPLLAVRIYIYIPKSQKIEQGIRDIDYVNRLAGNVPLN